MSSGRKTKGNGQWQHGQCCNAKDRSLNTPQAAIWLSSVDRQAFGGEGGSATWQWEVLHAALHRADHSHCSGLIWATFSKNPTSTPSPWTSLTPSFSHPTYFLSVIKISKLIVLSIGSLVYYLSFLLKCKLQGTLSYFRSGVGTFFCKSPEYFIFIKVKLTF